MTNINQRERKGNVSGTGRALFWLLGLALLATACTTACKGLFPASDNDKAAHAQSAKTVLHLDSFVVNLADPEPDRFLRIGIDLELENPLPAKETKEEEGESTARIRDSILSVLSTWRSDALLASDGKQKLKDAILRTLRERLPELGVKEVYFTDFLVQR